MAGPIDPFDVERPQLPDNAGELTATLRAMKEVLVDYRTRITALEESVSQNLGTMTGVIIPWGAAATTPPAGFAFCHGQELSRETDADLFAVIGVTWGAGNGTTTFNAPDMRGRAMRGFHDGTGRDYEPTRIIGSYQDDCMQTVTGKVLGIRLPWTIEYVSEGALKLIRRLTHAARLTSTGAHASYDLEFNNADSPDARTSEETVMKNAAANWIIKT